MAGFDLEILKQGQQATADALKERSALAAAIARQSARLDALNLQIAAFDKTGDRESADALREEATQLRADRAGEQTRYRTIDQNWVAAMNAFAENIDACDADPGVPLLLLPVRLETRYTPDGRTLRIRIFPDDVHIDQLDRGLSEVEQAAGRAYWNAVWQMPESDPAVNEAWLVLVKAVGRTRAAWTATALTPVNLGAAAPEGPAFPELDPPLRRAANARLLPDRFTAVAFQGALRSQAAGALITPELVTGLLADDGGERVSVNGVSVPPGAEWVIDFNQALAAGMAINLPLANAGAVDRLFVCGVRSSLEPAQAEQELTSLFTAHRCSRGIAFLTQGTPTNNTETDRAAWQQRPEPSPPALTTAAAGSNARVLADAFGIDARVFTGLPKADQAEQNAARAMAIALWSPTWGKFLESVTTVNRSGATLSDANKETTRTFFRDHVRARGPLPAIRIGQQPYGVLPTAAMSNARWKTQPGDTYEGGLLPLLLKVRRAWLSSVAQVARIPGRADLDQALRDVLGLSPISVGLRVRSVLSAEMAQTGSQISGAVTDADALSGIIEQLVYQDLNLLSFTRPLGSLEKKSRPLGLSLVADNDKDVILAIMGNGSPRISSVLQALCALAWNQVDKAAQAAAASSQVPSLTAMAVSLPPETRARISNLSGIAATASSQTIHAMADEIVAVTGEAGIARLSELQPAQPFRTSLGQLATDAVTSATRTTLAGFALGGWFRANAIKAELREALELVRMLPNEDRRILLSETLDLASHRLDAWLTGVVTRRHTAQRAARPSGIAVGAYGWIENIAPGKGLKPDGGYIHAPGLTHAATAGILRSAFMTHNPDAAGSGAYAVDLSSSRVRIALELMDGVRQGQPLGALLGYRIERALHEKRLDRFILILRSLAPLVSRLMTDRNDAAGTQAQESLASNNVVDGLRLLDLFSKNPNSIKTEVTAPPKNNPYIAAGTWPVLTINEWDAFTLVMQDAAAAADCAADMLLAESVHQLVQGNMSATAATLNAVANGDSPPPQPDVVRTPSTGIPFTHRLLIASQDGFESGAGGWNRNRPRALAEPRLEQWAESRFGDAANIVVHAPAGGPLVTLDTAALCALDLIYDSGDRVQLEQRIRAAMPAIAPDSVLADRTDAAWPAGSLGLGDAATFAGSLRTLLVNSQPSKVSDFVRSNEPAARAFSAAQIEAAAARATAARGGLLTLRDQLAQAIGAFNIEDLDTAVELRARLEAIAAYGVVTPIVEGEHLLAIAQMAADEASRRIDEAEGLLTGAPDEIQIARAGQSLFGDGFWILAAMDPPPQPDLLSAAMSGAPFTPPPARAEIRRFVRDTASVRAPANRASEALLLADTLGRAIPLRVAQLVEPGTPGGAAWVGGALDMSQPTPRNSITNLVLFAPADLDPGTPMVSLTIDAWNDVVPVREKRGKEADAPIDDQRVSGIALNAAAASARPPQAMLLAISPDGQRWTTDALVDTLAETLEMAKIRAVTLEITPGYASVLPAAYQASYSLQGEKVLDIGAVAFAKVADNILKYIKETP